MNFFKRHGIIPFALFGWLGYELLGKNKKFQEIQNDLIAALFLTAVDLFIAYLIFK